MLVSLECECHLESIKLSLQHLSERVQRRSDIELCNFPKVREKIRKWGIHDSNLKQPSVRESQSVTSISIPKSRGGHPEDTKSNFSLRGFVLKSDEMPRGGAAPALERACYS